MGWPGIKDRSFKEKYMAKNDFTIKVEVWVAAANFDFLVLWFF